MSITKVQLDSLLKKRGGLKARQIARELSLDRKQVSSFLHANPADYEQDEDFAWWVVGAAEVEMSLPSGWVSAHGFERLLREATSAGSVASLQIRFDEGCKLLFDAIARVLAVANHSVGSGIRVVLDFEASAPTKNYLNRAGFFDRLNGAVEVLPKRPRGSAALAYQGQSDALVELASIRLDRDNSGLVEDLCEKFVLQSSKEYLSAATTMFGELVNNVREHSEATNGFAGFQKYGGHRPHIQTVVSDDGAGIATTLRTTLAEHHTRLFSKYGAKSVESDLNLVLTAIRDGEVSRFGKGRGLGLKSSHQQTKKFDATFSVRQEEFSLTFGYQEQDLVLRGQEVGLYPLSGTHICFDFYLA